MRGWMGMGSAAVDTVVGVFIRARVDGDGDAGVGPAGWVPSLIESSGDFVQGWLCLSFVLGWPLLFCSAFERLLG